MPWESIFAAPRAIPWMLAGAYLAVALVFIVASDIDRWVHSEPFTPGKWESDDGDYWIELRGDGTGEWCVVRRDPEAPLSAGERVRKIDTCGDVTWTFTAQGQEPYGQLTIRGGWSPPTVHAGGFWNGGYDWDVLHYSVGNPTLVDLSLHRVADY